MTERYFDEAATSAELSAWAQWRAGAGVKGQIAQIAWREDEALLRRELNRDRFCLPIVTSDVELTDKALALLKSEDRKGHDALIVYHLGQQHGPNRGRASVEDIKRAAKLKNCSDVDATLRRAHENYRYCRGQLSRARSVNPSTGAAFRAVAA